MSTLPSSARPSGASRRSTEVVARICAARPSSASIALQLIVLCLTCFTFNSAVSLVVADNCQLLMQLKCPFKEYY